MRLEEMTQHANPYLLCWIDLAMTPKKLMDREEDFFTMDIEDGWAAPMFHIWKEDGDAVCFHPINGKYQSVEEDAPVEIGGQSPVPKRFALDDLGLAAECAIYFAKTGKLSPAVQWAEFSD